MLRTRPPRKSARKRTPLDLHALGTPPALILSQDQTLHQYLGPRETGLAPEGAPGPRRNPLACVDGRTTRVLACWLACTRPETPPGRRGHPRPPRGLRPRALRLRHTTDRLSAHPRHASLSRCPRDASARRWPIASRSVRFRPPGSALIESPRTLPPPRTPCQGLPERTGEFRRAVGWIRISTPSATAQVYVKAYHYVKSRLLP